MYTLGRLINSATKIRLSREPLSRRWLSRTPCIPYLDPEGPTFLGFLKSLKRKVLQGPGRAFFSGVPVPYTKRQPESWIINNHICLEVRYWGSQHASSYIHVNFWDSLQVYDPNHQASDVAGLNFVSTPFVYVY